MKSEKFEGHSSAMRELKPTPWLASEDILGKENVNVTISGCFLHRQAQFDAGRKEDVYALAFEGAKKQLVLNATNRRALVAMFGSNVADWNGKRIGLHVVKTKMMGEEVNGIRIKEATK